MVYTNDVFLNRISSNRNNRDFRKLSKYDLIDKDKKDFMNSDSYARINEKNRVEQRAHLLTKDLRRWF